MAQRETNLVWRRCCIRSCAGPWLGMLLVEQSYCCRVLRLTIFTLTQCFSPWDRRQGWGKHGWVTAFGGGRSDQTLRSLPHLPPVCRSSRLQRAKIVKPEAHTRTDAHTRLAGERVTRGSIALVRKCEHEVAQARSLKAPSHRATQHQAQHGCSCCGWSERCHEDALADCLFYFRKKSLEFFWGWQVFCFFFKVSFVSIES